MLQTAGYQAILHGHAGGYRSHVLAGGRWTVWHSTARQGAFPPLPHVDWQQGPTQAYYMSADPWPLAVLLHTVTPPNKRQEPGWVNPPALVWSPDQEEHLRAAWQGDAIRATDVPDLHAGPITHAHPAATLAVAQRGQQNPQWVVCMFSPADAHIVVCDPERLPGARSRDPRGRLHPHDCQGATGGRTPRPPAPGQAEGQSPGGEAGGVAGSGAARRPRAPAGGSDRSVPLATGLPRPAMEGQARPPNRLHALANVAASRRAARCHLGSRARARDTSPRCGGPGPHTGATHGATGQPAFEPAAEGAIRKSVSLPPARGATEPTKCPLCADKYYTSGAMLEHLAWHAVHAAAPADDKEAATNILQGRVRRSPWHAPYTRRPPPQAADHAHGDEEAPGAAPGTGGAAPPWSMSIPAGLAPLAPLAPPVPRAPLWAPLGTGSADAAHPDALAAPANPAAMPMRDS